MALTIAVSQPTRVAVPISWRRKILTLADLLTTTAATTARMMAVVVVAMITAAATGTGNVTAGTITTVAAETRAIMDLTARLVLLEQTLPLQQQEERPHRWEEGTVAAVDRLLVVNTLRILTAVTAVHTRPPLALGMTSTTRIEGSAESVVDRIMIGHHVVDDQGPGAQWVDLRRGELHPAS
jgi:hypothetical protein